MGKKLRQLQNTMVVAEYKTQCILYTHYTTSIIELKLKNCCVDFR